MNSRIQESEKHLTDEGKVIAFITYESDSLIFCNLINDEKRKDAIADFIKRRMWRGGNVSVSVKSLNKDDFKEAVMSDMRKQTTDERDNRWKVLEHKTYRNDNGAPTEQLDSWEFVGDESIQLRSRIIYKGDTSTQSIHLNGIPLYESAEKKIDGEDVLLKAESYIEENADSFQRASDIINYGIEEVDKVA